MFLFGSAQQNKKNETRSLNLATWKLLVTLVSIVSVVLYHESFIRWFKEEREKRN